jgi:hypothetical protein
VTAAALTALLLTAWPAPQAAEIHRYMVDATGKQLDHCARSRTGEGLVDATGALRRELHEFSGLPATTCVPAADQVRYLAVAFPRHYPKCALRFAAGDLAAFRRCWGWGRSR